MDQLLKNSRNYVPPLAGVGRSIAEQFDWVMVLRSNLSIAATQTAPGFWFRLAPVVDARAEADQTLETTLVGVFEAEIIEADLQSKTAFITLKFASEQINVTRDAEGTIVDDDPNQIASANSS